MEVKHRMVSGILRRFAPAVVVLGLLMSGRWSETLTTAAQTEAASAQAGSSSIAVGDWPQLGRDPQRTNYSPQQINPPYCYAWKWYEAPMATRAQPVVANARLFIGAMDGAVYARNASTGAPLWKFQTNGPIRHSLAISDNGAALFTGSYDGYTYALDAASGALLWKTFTGSSGTAPLFDQTRGRVVVASTYGSLTALNVADGSKAWEYASGAPVLTSPSLSADGRLIYFGNEALRAVAVNAATGALTWQTTLQGQSLAGLYPVAAGTSVIYRSQPLHFFHTLLQEGDDVLNEAGPYDGPALTPSVWASDWASARPRILNYLTTQPTKQTFFVLNADTGASRGVAPVLYTTGNNDVPNVPVISPSNTYVTYRARHGIQTDNGAVHVSTQYDAELGQMNLSTLDITGLTASQTFNYQFRLTSDEPAAMTMGGNILWIHNWERIGGLDVSTGQLHHLGNVSNVWPECYGGTTCGPTGPNPFFPLRPGEAAYPFPSPRVTDGGQQSGVVVANNMLYWRVIAGGLAGLKSGSCSAPQVWDAATASSMTPSQRPDQPAAVTVGEARSFLPAVSRNNSAFGIYVTDDLTTPVADPPVGLRDRLRSEVKAMLQLANGQHLLPFYLERGFSSITVWPYNANNCSSSPCVASIGYEVHGSVFWHDPGELLYTLALAYPYLDSTLQAQVKNYVAAEMQRYPPLQDLPWGDPNRDWLQQGAARERYAVPFRSQLNNWPPVAANASALYALWLWSKNTRDWTYACSNWNAAKALFNARRSSVRYYADISGLIGYARLAQALKARNCAGVTQADYDIGLQAATAAMQAGAGRTNFEVYRTRANSDYLDPRGLASGWSMPVFFGLTPEVGRYLREQTGGAAQAYVTAQQSGNGMRWWYITRVGVHAEEGETAFIAPSTGWSHFLARAYIMGDTRATLQTWLDRPWTIGDLYSIQKMVATLHAP